MKLAIFSVLMIFAVSGYAKLDCESEEYSYNKTVQELCEQQNQKMEEVKKDNQERFSQRLLQGKQLQNLKDTISQQKPSVDLSPEPAAQTQSINNPAPATIPAAVAPATPVVAPSHTPTPAATPSHSIKYY